MLILICTVITLTWVKQLNIKCAIWVPEVVAKMEEVLGAVAIHIGPIWMWSGRQEQMNLCVIQWDPIF